MTNRWSLKSKAQADFDLYSYKRAAEVKLQKRTWILHANNILLYNTTRNLYLYKMKMQYQLDHPSFYTELLDLWFSTKWKCEALQINSYWQIKSLRAL